MDLFQQFQNMMGQGTGGGGNQGGAEANPLAALMNPAVIGGLVGALFSGKTGARGSGGLEGIIGGLLGGQGAGGMAGGIGGLLGSLFGAGDAPATGDMPAAAPPVNASEATGAATRLIRALVFAAKSDGHIDDNERNAINNQLNSLNLGDEARRLVQQAMGEPLDPRLVAEGVRDRGEAMRLYALSAAVSNADQIMEKNYLGELARSLRLTDQEKAAIDAQLRQG